jgi:S1/P1 Nuclease
MNPGCGLGGAMPLSVGVASPKWQVGRLFLPKQAGAPMKIRTFVTTFAFLAVLSGHALGWGYQGHEVIGSIADQLLGPGAKQQVTKILGVELRVAGPWADCVRSVVRLSDGTFQYAPSRPEYRIPCKPFETAVETARMEDYVSRNWYNCLYEPSHGCDEAYHFADVEIQHDDYSRSYVGTNDHDVVSAINAAILVLRDQPAPLPFSIRDKKEALFLLAHFIGDLHQPLHVGAIYLDPNGHPLNPDQRGFDPATSTAGGNFISDQGNNFHAEWDAIPADLGESASPDMVKKAQAIAPTDGAVENFAVAWASETVRASHSAFGGATFTGAGPSHWVIHFADRAAYWNRQDDLKRDQLAKAGARLAQLLNAIWPSNPVPAEKVTECTVVNICYCVTAANRDAITANVARVRQRIADQRATGKMIGYLSIPLSTTGGGYFGVNREVAQQTKDWIEGRFGSGSVWVLNPGTEGNLSDNASGADYMYMWTQILEGRGGFGEDFDFFYFTGPRDFARFFGLTGTGDAERIGAYFDERLATDADLMSAVATGKLSRRGFRNYYSLRASTAFSYGSHDEWNISHILNQRRRASDQFGVGSQIAILFDAHGVTPGSFEGSIADGYVGSCH